MKQELTRRRHEPIPRQGKWLRGVVQRVYIAGGVMIGLLLTFVSAVVATAAAVFERTLQSAVDLKSENDLTV